MTSGEERKRVEYLQQKLNSWKIQLEKLERYLNGVNIDVANAKARLDSISTLYDNALKYNEELSVIQPTNPLFTMFLDAESRYFEAVGSVAKLQTAEPLANSTLNASNITITERQDLPKLPEIKIPLFDGKREHWASYKNKFIALVHSRTDISDAVKCSQLFNSLTDQAQAKINQFDPNGEDYPKAWKTRLDFYDHNRIVAVEHLNAILDLPQLNKASADELSTLLDKTRQHIHILDGLGVHSRDDLIVRIVERCLPPGIRNKWQDKLDMDELPKLENLLKFIQTTIFKQQAFDYSSTPSGIPNPKKRGGEKMNQSAQKMAKTTSHTLVTSSIPDSSSSQATYVTCPKCKGPHRLFKCPMFNGLAVQDRWNFVKEIKACYNCLWTHPFPCKSDKHCKKCERKHHTLLHNDKEGNQAKSKESTASTPHPAQA